MAESFVPTEGYAFPPYAKSRLYAELSTGFNFGTGQNTGVAWFVLGPRPHPTSLVVGHLGQGYVKSPQLASEYVAPQPRDTFSNWSTRVWYARLP